MIIKGTERSARTVEIEMSSYDAFLALRKEVLRTVGVNDPGAYVDSKGRVVSDERVVRGGGHSWITTSMLVETPNENQLKAFRAFGDLYSLLIRD